MRHLLSLTGSNFVEPELITSYNMKNRKKRDTILFFSCTIIPLNPSHIPFWKWEKPGFKLWGFPHCGISRIKIILATIKKLTII